MQNRNIYPLSDYERAGSYDLVELQSPPGLTNMIVPKRILDLLFTALFITQVNTHLHGSSGSGKTTLVQCLTQVPANLPPLCEAYGIEEVRVHCHTFPITSVETPAELYRIRSISPERGTFYEDSELWQWLSWVDQQPDGPDVYMAHIRELFRGQESVEHALLDIISDGPLHAPDGRVLERCGKRITWVADSNMGVASALVNQADTATLRRFPVQIPIAPTRHAERVILERLLANEKLHYVPKHLDSLLLLSARIREAQKQGHFLEIQPEIPVLLSIIRLAARQCTMDFPDLLLHTLFGACQDEQEHLPALFEEAFGQRKAKALLPVGEDLL
jgi:hypothetical protein